jgi:hypothetical protein
MAHSLRRTLAATLVTAAAAAGPLAAQNAPTPPSVTVGGVVYAQFAAQLDSAPPGANSNSNFDIKRAYLNVIGRFSGGIMTRVTGDIYQNADGSRTYRLKYAFVNWTPAGSALTYRLGLITTPWLDWEEALWDYRMQGAMAVDRNGYMSSADFGAGVDGNINSELVDFQASVFNGNNYSGAPTDQQKAYAGRVSVRVLGTDDASRVGGLRLTAYAQGGAPTSGGERDRYIGMVSFHSKMLTLAGEYVATVDSTTGYAAATAKPEVKGSIISAYGVLHIPDSPLAIIGRVDIVDPNTANSTVANSNDKRTTIIAGLSYQLTPNLRLLLDLDNTTLQGSVTGSATAPRKLQQVAFQTQFTF